MIIIRRLLVLLLITICCALVANADNNKTFVKSGTTYTNSSTGRQKANSTPVATGCTWVDSKGVQYPVYISESGSCYIIKVSKKTSSKTGKEYRQYLGPEVSEEICKRLGREYKAKKK